MDDKNYAYIAEKLYEELEKCCMHYGADITISVTRNGIKTEYPLYDHAALVQGLMAAVDYFISELQLQAVSPLQAHVGLKWAAGQQIVQSGPAEASYALRGFQPPRPAACLIEAYYVLQGFQPPRPGPI